MKEENTKFTAQGAKAYLEGKTSETLGGNNRKTPLGCEVTRGNLSENMICWPGEK